MNKNQTGTRRKENPKLSWNIEIECSESNQKNAKMIEKKVLTKVEH